MGPPGALLGPPGALLGPSWGPPGALLGPSCKLCFVGAFKLTLYRYIWELGAPRLNFRELGFVEALKLTIEIVEPAVINRVGGPGALAVTGPQNPVSGPGRVILKEMCTDD